MTEKICFYFMYPPRIINLLEMKVKFSIYVGLSVMIGVVFTTAINNVL